MQTPQSKPPLLERLINRVSPKWALEREKSRAAMARMGGYVGGGYSERFAGWTPGVRDADSDIVYDLREMRGRSRDMARNAPIASGAIENMATYVVGTGLTVQSRIDAELLGLSDDEASKYQGEFERYFNTWAGSQFADYYQGQNFYELQDLALRAELESGDAFALLVKSKAKNWPYRIAVQIVEADRVSNPNHAMDTDVLTQGIAKVDGIATSIHIADRHPGRTISGKPLQWLERPFYAANGSRKVLHLFHKKRPNQTRGVPWLAPVIAKLKQLDRYSDAEVDAAVNAAVFAVFATMDAEAFDGLFDEASKATYIENAKSWDGGLNSGKVINTFPGETISSPSPGRPNPVFEQFFQAVNNEIAVGLGLPREVVLKSFNASYSASRAALMDAWRSYQVRRARLSSRFGGPIYEEIIADGVAMGHLAAPGFFSHPFIRAAWLGSSWSGDGPGALDPLKEVSAAEKRIKIGLTTLPKESLAFDGSDWEANHRTSVRVTAERVEGGLEAPVMLQQPGAAPPQLPAGSMPGPEDDDPGENEDPTELD